jgi:hypothetical protein
VTPSSAQGDHNDPPEAAVTTGARAAAAFAERHNLAIPAELRENLAHDVIVAALPHLATGNEPGE